MHSHRQYNFELVNTHSPKKTRLYQHFTKRYGSHYSSGSVTEHKTMLAISSNSTYLQLHKYICTTKDLISNVYCIFNVYICNYYKGKTGSREKKELHLKIASTFFIAVLH